MPIQKLDHCTGPTMVLAAGTLRRMFVDRKAFARGEPAIIVEETNGKRYYGRNVKGRVDAIGSYVVPAFEFVQDDGTVAPVMWIQTDAELEILL